MCRRQWRHGIPPPVEVACSHGCPLASSPPFWSFRTEAVSRATKRTIRHTSINELSLGVGPPLLTRFSSKPTRFLRYSVYRCTGSLGFGIMVERGCLHTQPEPIGGASHITKIEFLEMPTNNPEAQAAITELQSGLDPEPVEKAHRLAVTGSLDQSLVIYFINIGSTIWGIWCGSDGASCRSDSRFMVLDMRNGN